MSARCSVRGVVAAVTAAATLGALSACASQVTGKGTGAGPHGGPPAASASAGTPSGSPSSAPSSASGQPKPAKPLRSVTVHGSGTDYVVKVWAEKQFGDCAAHAYGTPVITFLKRHACSGLKSLLATTTVDGRAVAFAQRTIGFRGGESSYRAAGEFRRLVSRSGTGNLNDLLREGSRLPGGPAQVPFPNAFNAQAQDNSVTVVEAWYVKGSTPDNDSALERMEQDIFLQV